MMKRVMPGMFMLMTALTGCYFEGPCIVGSGPVVSEIREINDFSSVTNTGSFEVSVLLSDSYSVEVQAQENLLPVIETYVSGNRLVVKTRNGTCIGAASPVIVHVSLPFIESLENVGSGKLELDRAEGELFECANTGSGMVRVDSVLAASLVIENSGSGSIFVDESFVDEVSIVQSGSGTAEAVMLYDASDMVIHHSGSGKIRSTLANGLYLEVILSGSGRINLTGDVVEAAYSLVSSGRIDAMELMAADVKATISGSGNIYVYATETLEAQITGSGDVIYRGDPDIKYRITGSGEIRQY